MRLNRRGFFGVSAGAVVGAKQAAAGLAEQTGIASLGVDSGADLKAGGSGDWVGRRVSFLANLGGKIPAHRHEGMKQQAAHVRYLDPDIAVLQSFSFAAKVRMQRQRNLERMEREFWHGHEWNIAEQAIEEQFGGWV